VPRVRARSPAAPPPQTSSHTPLPSSGVMIADLQWMIPVILSDVNVHTARCPLTNFFSGVLRFFRIGVPSSESTDSTTAVCTITPSTRTLLDPGGSLSKRRTGASDQGLPPGFYERDCMRSVWKAKWKGVDNSECRADRVWIDSQSILVLFLLCTCL
jgi:hypothetical protein